MRYSEGYSTRTTVGSIAPVIAGTLKRALPGTLSVLSQAL